MSGMTPGNGLKVLKNSVVVAFLVALFDGVSLVVVLFTFTESDHEFDVITLG